MLLLLLITLLLLLLLLLQAVLFGDDTKKALTGFAGLMGASLATVGVAGDMGLGFGVGATMAMACSVAVKKPSGVGGFLSALA